MASFTMLSGSIGASVETMSSVAAVTSDMPGDITQRAVERQRDSSTRSPGRRTEHGDRRHQVPAAPRFGRSVRGCGLPSTWPAHAEPLGGDVLGDVSDSLHALPEQDHIAASDGDEHVDDRRLLDRVEPAHRAEVDEPE